MATRGTATATEDEKADRLESDREKEAQLWAARASQTKLEKTATDIWPCH